MPARGEQRRRWRSRLPLLCTLIVATLPVAAALAVRSKPAVLRDTTADVGGPLDLQRAGLTLPSEGRLRFVVKFAAEVTPATLLAKSGPPGSFCVRIWTDPEADTTATRADRLVCVTADKDEKLRAGVYQQRDAGLPRRVAAASVAASPSGRSFVVRVSQSALARPPVIRFSVESTSPGCDRVACIDTVPDGGAARRFRLR